MISRRWRKKRDAVVKRDGGCCRVCNSDVDVQVHHRTYVNLCREKMVDLITLCDKCHSLFHEHLKLVKVK